MSTQPTLSRRYDLDWLRVFAILAVFFYHSARFFDLDGWHIKNAVTYSWVQTRSDIMALWMMPLIFLISGASIYFALNKGGPGQFVKDKVLRLLIPLIAGVFTHITLQVYLERISRGQFSGTYFEFLPHYFDGLYVEGGSGNFAWMGLHLWYLLVLFVFSLLLLPVFFGFKRQLGGRILRRVGDFLALPGAVYLLVLPTTLLNHADLMNDVRLGGWSFPHYLWFFFCGFLIISNGRVQQRISQLRWLNLAVGLALVIGPLVSPPLAADPHTDLAAWCWLFTFLGFGFKHLNFNTPFLSYANEAVLPFYILHQTVLIVTGYFVLQSSLPDFAKWLIIASLSLLLIMGIYEYGVRRVNVLRFLFGLKPLPRQKIMTATALSPAKS